MNKKQIVLDAFNFRYACKAFNSNRKITDEDFDFILETGRLSPSSFGFEPWRFLVIERQDIKDAIFPHAWGAQRQLPGASHFVVILARKGIETDAESAYIHHMMHEVQKLPKDIAEMKGNFYSNFRAKDFDLSNPRKQFDWAAKQAYIALGNMMTAAAHLEIDSCPIEGFDQEKVDAVLAEAGVYDASQFGVAVMVAFGYRAEDTRVPVKTRQDMKHVVQWL